MCIRDRIKDTAEVTEIGAMEMVKGGEIVHDDVTIPQITVKQEKFNTVNLQQEIAKGMQQIMEAKGKNEVADTMDTCLLYTSTFICEEAYFKDKTRKCERRAGCRDKACGR